MCGCVANSIIGQSDILFHVVLGVGSYTFSQNQLENERCIKDIVVLSLRHKILPSFSISYGGLLCCFTHIAIVITPTFSIIS